MSRTVLIAMLLPALSLGLAARAPAGAPDPANCEVPGLITLVGRATDGSADPLGTFTVVLRDFNRVPKVNWPVALDLSGCPDIRLAADQHDPSVVIDCASHSIRTISGPGGSATFRVIGHAANLGASPGSTGPCLEVFTEGLFLGSVRVAALDQNGSGLDGGDLSLLLRDYFSGQPFARSDYDGNGALDGNDLSLWLAALFAGGSSTGGGPACP